METECERINAELTRLDVPDVKAIVSNGSVCLQNHSIVSSPINAAGLIGDLVDTDSLSHEEQWFRAEIVIDMAEMHAKQ